MTSILKTLGTFSNLVGGLKCDVEPTNEAEYQELITNTENRINPDQELWNGTPATWQEVLDKKAELEAEETNKENLKTSAKAKLVAGTPLTQEEADAL